MILFKIDPNGFTLDESKRDAPRAIYVNGVSRWIKPAKSMEIKIRQIQVLRTTSSVQRIQFA